MVGGLDLIRLGLGWLERELDSWFAGELSKQVGSWGSCRVLLLAVDG